MPTGEKLEDEPREKSSYNLRTMDVDEDSGMEEMPIVLPIASSVPPMTMREMAESAARKREEASGAANDTDVQQRPLPSARVSEGRPKTRATRQSRASSSTPATSTKGGPRLRVTRRASARKRERDTETDEDTTDDQDDEGESLTSPKKRTRVMATLPTSAPSTRTLRPRASKTLAQIQDEKEQASAFRRATAS